MKAATRFAFSSCSFQEELTPSYADAQLPLVEQTRSGGLGDCAMEGFDAGRLRIALGLPHWWEPIIFALVGYAERRRRERPCCRCTAPCSRATPSLPSLIHDERRPRRRTNRFSGVIVNENTSLTAEAGSVFESSNDVHSIAITVLISIMAS